AAIRPEAEAGPERLRGVAPGCRGRRRARGGLGVATPCRQSDERRHVAQRRAPARTARAWRRGAIGGDTMNLPDLFVSGLDECGCLTFQRWRPPPVDDFATPSDLARIISAFREWVQANSGPGFQPITARGAISERGLERLLSLAYQASFDTNEGRCTRPRPFVPDAGRPAPSLRINHRFTPPKQLSDPKMISRLAPTLVADDSSLVVQDTGGDPACVGISLLDAQDAGRPLLGMPRGWTGTAGGLQLQILAPGEVRVSQGLATSTLRAKRMLASRRVASVAQVDHWIEELTRDLTTRCSDEDAEWNVQPFTVPGADVRALWSHVLREAFRLRHGGAFVVVPDPRRGPGALEDPTQPPGLGGGRAAPWLALARGRPRAGGRVFAGGLRQPPGRRQ